MVAWTKEMGAAIRQHPEDFPKGQDSIIFSFDNEIKQQVAGDMACERAGIDLQKNRRLLAPYSPEHHKVSG